MAQLVVLLKTRSISALLQVATVAAHLNERADQVRRKWKTSARTLARPNAPSHPLAPLSPSTHTHSTACIPRTFLIFRGGCHEATGKHGDLEPREGQHPVVECRHVGSQPRLRTRGVSTGNNRRHGGPGRSVQSSGVLVLIFRTRKKNTTTKSLKAFYLLISTGIPRPWGLRAYDTARDSICLCACTSNVGHPVGFVRRQLLPFRVNSGIAEWL
jgi:hypothetical protein